LIEQVSVSGTDGGNRQKRIWIKDHALRPAGAGCRARFRYGANGSGCELIGADCGQITAVAVERVWTASQI